MGDAKRNTSSSGSDEEIQAQVAKAVEGVKELQDSAASFVTGASADEQSLRQRAQSLDSSIRRLRSQLDSLLSSKALDPKLAEKLAEDLQRATCVLVDGDAASFLPGKSQGGRFLRMFGESVTDESGNLGDGTKTPNLKLTVQIRWVQDLFNLVRPFHLQTDRFGYPQFLYFRNRPALKITKPRPSPFLFSKIKNRPLPIPNLDYPPFPLFLYPFAHP